MKKILRGLLISTAVAVVLTAIGGLTVAVLYHPIICAIAVCLGIGFMINSNLD
jgi:hypothetical protein